MCDCIEKDVNPSLESWGLEIAVEPIRRWGPKNVVGVMLPLPVRPKTAEVRVSISGEPRIYGTYCPWCGQPWDFKWEEHYAEENTADS